MNSISSGATRVRRPSDVATHARTQQTLLFPSLIKQIDQGRCLSVLEIGAASPVTLNFFSQFKCRLHFAAMYTDPVLQMQIGDTTEAELVAHFEESLGFMKGARFDLCLFWDFMNYLDDKTMRAFSTFIRPYLHMGTRAHAFTVRTLETSFANLEYVVEEPHLFGIRPRKGRQARMFPHTQTTLLNLISCFDIDQGMLLPDGRAEVLMTASL